MTITDIEYRIFGLEFGYRATIAESNSVFIPSGWDTSEKIKTDAAAGDVSNYLQKVMI